MISAIKRQNKSQLLPCQFCIDLYELRKKQDDEKKAMRNVVPARDTPTVDEEELIMRSLAGYGPDPEVFGF